MNDEPPDIRLSKSDRTAARTDSKACGRTQRTKARYERKYLLYALVIVRLARRDLVWINVTTHPTADWIARQITEAFPWAEAPRYVIRDRDCVYGAAVTHRLRTMGIRDKPIAPGS